MISPEWTKQWAEQSASIRNDCTYEDSALQLRALIRTGLLRFTDMRDHPEKFFLAHRMLVGLRGPGFWIRFTVQYNLFAGTVLGLGGKEQVASLDEMQRKGTLGCFALTEKLAGVNSGLVVLTTATWNPATQSFVLQTSPDEEDRKKNWISQGLVADKAAVIADLIVNGKSYGPHGFLVDMRDSAGKLAPGIVLGDMGRKTTGNDLDNAWIQFNSFVVPKSTLLNRYCEIQNDQYVQTTKDKVTFAVFGQRLLSGRTCVAQAAATFCYNLYAETQHYAQERKCWSPNGKVALGSVPHIKALFDEAQASLFQMQTYMLKVEAALCECLKRDTIPPPELVQAIAVGKIAVVEQAISLSFRLKQEVGSYALMSGNGFEDMDFLQCCKFAEGDGRILQQKLARDQVRLFQQGKLTGVDPKSHEAHLLKVLHEAGKDGWDLNWKSVYGLASEIQQRVVREWIGDSLTPQPKL